MTLLQVAALLAVGLAGGAVVLCKEQLRQALVLGVYGLALTMLFFVFQAPTWRCRRSSSPPSACR